MVKLLLLIALASTASAAPNPWTRCMKARPHGLFELGDDTIVSGAFDGGADLGDGKLHDDRSVFVARYDKAGTLTWAYIVAGRVDLTAIVVEPDGSVLIAGDAYEPIDFGGGMTPLQSSYQDAWLARLGADGKLRWAKRFGKPSAYNQIVDLRVDGANVELVAEVGYGIDFGKGAVGDPKKKRYENDTQAVRVRYSRDGALVDAVPRVGDKPRSKLVHTGEGEAPHVVKLDFLDGADHWQTSFTNSGRGIDGATGLDARGNAFVAGSFEYDLDLRGGHRLETAQTAAFVASYDRAGAVRWMTAFGGGAREDNLWIDELAADARGDVWVGGPYYGKLAIAGKPIFPVAGMLPVTNAIDSHDGGFVAVLSNTGTLKWARSLPARLNRLEVGAHVLLAYGHGAGTDSQCIAHDPVLP